METIKRLYGKYRELILYVVCGGLTTLVNFAVYFGTKEFLGIHYIAANILAWIAAVAFAYVVNKIYVFRSSENSFKALMFQIVSFAGMRLLSLGAETLILYVCVDIFGYDDNIVKIAASVLVVLSNYIFSKLFIFKKSK